MLSIHPNCRSDPKLSAWCFYLGPRATCWPHLGLKEEVDDALWASVSCPVRGHADGHALTVPPGSDRVHLLCAPKHCQGQTSRRRKKTSEDLVFASSRNEPPPAAGLSKVNNSSDVLLMNCVVTAREEAVQPAVGDADSAGLDQHGRVPETLSHCVKVRRVNWTRLVSVSETITINRNGRTNLPPCSKSCCEVRPLLQQHLFSDTGYFHNRHIPAMTVCFMCFSLHWVKSVTSWICVRSSPVMAGSDLELALVSDTLPSPGSAKLVSLRNSCFLDS